ncbi:MAG: PhzF family phenazine biosynthesis protein [Defluviicoccus sp.]|nr:PhzF family phenazine biosynthesis protein [Defluviicoccus sp.]MDE0382719.1 PhzF family phenazine biosynthesis protein [Defluviicoccus sp.]
MTGPEGRAALDCSIVDVFAERPLAGNQLAVVRGCARLDQAEMQAIAREMNFSETAFVVDERHGEASVRIFTTDRELPFAGHPTLGTAWVLARDRDSYVLDLAAGRVRVAFGADGIVWMEPPEVALGEAADPERVAALLGLAAAELDDRYPSRFATVGPWFLLAGVKTLEALRRIAVDPVPYRELALGGWLSLFVFSEEPYNEDASFSARMLTFHHGLHEDPATGSANAAFAAHLRSLGAGGRVVVEQGFEIGRPSRLYLEVADPIRVGGKVHPVLTGTLAY